MSATVCEVFTHPIPPPTKGMPAETGAIVDFWGVVRMTEGEAAISGLEYEAHHAMAVHQLRLIADEAIKRFELQRVSIQHRVGFVPVGEASLLVRVGSQHRAPAFRGSEWIVEELKKRAPIWKHPRFIGSDHRSPEQSSASLAPSAA